MSKKSAGTSFPGQLEDEEVLLFFRRHPIVMRKGFIVVAVCLLGGALIGMVLSRNDYLMSDLLLHFLLPIILGLVVGLIGFLYYWIGWYFSLCIVTNQRFLQISQTGIFKKRSVNDIALSRILSVNYEIEGFWENALGFGTIIIQTLVGDFLIRSVGKPATQQSAIVHAIKQSGVELSKETVDETT